MDKKKKNRTIPIVFCFNDKYAIPAMVSISSLLKNADPGFFYELYVLHSDISQRHQICLERIVHKFRHAEIAFVNMQECFLDTFRNVQNQAYWSKEIFYKCILSSLFPQYDRIIVTDVDVLFLDDIAAEWEIFCQDNQNYLAGYSCLIKKENKDSAHAEMIYQDWKPEEREKVITGAGFWFQNLTLMRKNQIEEQFLAFIDENTWRLTQPEQQVVNIVCYPHIHLLHPRGMVCSWDYDNYKTEMDFCMDRRYSADIVKESLQHPIQLHYAGRYKPWNAVWTTKSGLWWKELFRQYHMSLWLECILNCLKDHLFLEMLRDSFRRNISHSAFLRKIYSAYRFVKH